MNFRLKLALMNLAVAAALFYRWRTGTSLTVLLVTGVIVFTLVNVLLFLSNRKFNRPNRYR